MTHRSKQRGVLEGPMLYLMVALGVALAASLAAGGGAAWYLDGKLEKANGRATAAEAARAAEEQSRQGFQAAGAACSASLDKLTTAQAAMEKLWAAQMKASEAKTAKAEQTVKEILASHRPAGMDECTATRKELDNEVDRRATRP